MSQTKPAAIVQHNGPDESAKLIVDESPYIFLPSLGHIFGDSEALILQQLHWTLHEKPHFAGEPLRRRRWKGHLWIRIEMWMWWDDLEGLSRHLSERTFYRKKARLEQFGVLLTTKELNRERDDNTLWWAIDYARLKEHEEAYLSELRERRAERDQQREFLRREDPAAHWRPNIRIPGPNVEPDSDVAGASCQSGRAVSPLVAKARLPHCQSGSAPVSEWQDGNCQSGSMGTANLAASTSRNKEEVLEEQQEHQQHAQQNSGAPVGIDVVVDVVVDVVESSIQNPAPAAPLVTQKPEAPPKTPASPPTAPSPILTHPNAGDLDLARGNESAMEGDPRQRRRARSGEADLVPALSEAGTPPPAAAGAVAQLTQKLAGLDTGLTPAVIAPLVARDPEHAARVLAWWPHYDHAAFTSPPPAVLRSMLSHPEKWAEPENLAGARRDRDAKRDRAELQAAAESRAKARRDEEQGRAQEAAATWAGLDEAARTALIGTLPRTPRGSFIAELVQNSGGIERIERDSKNWTEFFVCVGAEIERGAHRTGTPDGKASPSPDAPAGNGAPIAPESPTAGDSAPDGESGPEAGSEALAAILRAAPRDFGVYVAQIVNRVQAGMDVADIEDCRDSVCGLLDDDEWAQVAGETRRQLRRAA